MNTKRLIVLILLGCCIGWWLSPRSGFSPDPVETPCPGADSAGYVLTDVYPDGSFRCEKG